MFQKTLNLAAALALLYALAACSHPASLIKELQPALDARLVEEATTAALTPIQDGRATATQLSPAQVVCDEIAGYASQIFNQPVKVTTENFNNLKIGLTGAGCSVQAGGSGVEVTNWNDALASLLDMAVNNGWVEDLTFSGGNAYDLSIVYRRNGMVCLMNSKAGPLEENLCTSEIPRADCMDMLGPAQKAYSIVYNCSIDTYMPFTRQTPISESGAVRIQFDAGESSRYSPGDLAPNATRRFVLWLEEGQTMSIQVTSEPLNKVSVHIQGDNGLVLVPASDAATAWSGKISDSGDYFIEVVNLTSSDILYATIISIQ